MQGTHQSRRSSYAEKTDASPEVQADFTGASRDGMQDELATTTKTNTDKLDGLTTNRIWTRWTYSSPAR
ncbi:hypothetical protein F441_21385, partial [Phytophthora nicotianae CJ01A1]